MKFLTYNWGLVLLPVLSFVLTVFVIGPAVRKHFNRKDRS